MNAYRSKPFAFPWPPVIYGLAIAAALLFQLVFPFSFPETSLWLTRLVGGGLVLLAVFLDIWAMRTLLDCHTTILPHRCSTHLVTTGPYRFTRNPIYLGHTLTTAGIGILLHNPWFLLTTIVSVAVTTLVAVRREELHLLSRFGIEFERYCRTTTRWI
ncbi:MAG: isoprenylcysteine carboxylmethyltransferase family protein [Shinella sp.]|nr:isoprenylcysteine carboxylmethyltransferase family protein [Shinella sp.]